VGCGLFSWLRPSIENAAFRKLGSFPEPLSKSEMEAKRTRRGDSARWAISFVIWGFGAYILLELWYWGRGVADPAGYILDAMIYLVATFYFLALGPIREWVSRMLADR